MADAAVQLRVLRRGPRTDDLLAATARALGLDDLPADDHGVVRVRIGGRPPQAWEAVRTALDESGSDWRERIHLPPRPSR